MKANMARVERLENLLAQRDAAKKAVEAARNQDPARKAAEELAQLDIAVAEAQLAEKQAAAADKQAQLDRLAADARKAAPRILAECEKLAAECERMQADFIQLVPRTGTPEAELCSGAEARLAMLEIGQLQRHLRTAVDGYTLAVRVRRSLAP